ncbi:MAG: hypothetical protein V3T83_11315 [Acidobacteriota bacterium]
MIKETDEISRRVAKKLAGEIDPLLPQLTEAVLGGESGAGGRPGSFDAGLSIAAASFLVSMVGVAWPIYKDILNRKQKPSRQAVSRRVRVRIQDSADIKPAQRDRMIEVVVEEIFAHGEAEPSDQGRL